MAKFVYKFESIKRIKETLEKKAQKEVALIEIDIEKKKNEYNKVADEENRSLKNFSQKAVTVGELKFKKGYELCLKKKRDEITKDIDKLNIKRDKKMNELIQKTKEHKIFNKLEEKHSEKFLFEQNKQELGFIDELATQKFVRRKK